MGLRILSSAASREAMPVDRRLEDAAQSDDQQQSCIGA
jgi:hypothetical protein